jgi:hypothetical protein
METFRSPKNLAFPKNISNYITRTVLNVDFGEDIEDNNRLLRELMELLKIAARWEGIVIVTALGAVTLWRLMRLRSFDGLLRDGDGSFSPARVQLLMVTVLTAMQYLLTALTMHDHSMMPAVPDSLVAGLGGSQLTYLGAKAWRLMGSPPQGSNKR